MGSCSIFFFFFCLSGSLGAGGALTGDFLPRLDTGADLTGAGFFLLAIPSTISTAVLLPSFFLAWPGKLSSAFVEE